MRAVAIWCAAGAFAICFGACASGRPAPARAMPGDTAVSVRGDSLDVAVLENRFVEEHARLLRELQALEDAGTSDARMLETLALVSASEEMYLEGRIAVAVQILDEAARTLKTKR
jgi:hypothetical protein